MHAAAGLPPWGGGKLSHDDVVDIKNLIRTEGNVGKDFDIATYGSSANPDDTSRVSELASAGLTWWIEVAQAFSDTFDQVRERIRQGPPKI